MRARAKGFMHSILYVADNTIVKIGGGGGSLLPPLLASSDEHYTSAIIARI